MRGINSRLVLLVIPKRKGLAILSYKRWCRNLLLQTEQKHFTRSDVMNYKQEIGNCKALITKYQNQISNCFDEDLKNSLQYKLNQEQLKLESFELLLSLNQKVSRNYE